MNKNACEVDGWIMMGDEGGRWREVLQGADEGVDYAGNDD